MSRDTAEQRWHLRRGKKEFGSYTGLQLAALRRKGELNDTDQVRLASSGRWTSLVEIESLRRVNPPPLANTPSKHGIPAWKRVFLIFSMALNPGLLIKNYLQEYRWPWALLVSGLAYMLFFYQAGLDLRRVTVVSGGGFSLIFTGLLYGTLGVTLLALVAWVLSAPFSEGRSATWSVKAFALGYAPALVYTGSGLLANIFLGWNTALSFGLPGVLWAARPMLATLREMTGGRLFYSLFLTLLFSLVLFTGWALLL